MSALFSLMKRRPKIHVNVTNKSRVTEHTVQHLRHQSEKEYEQRLIRTIYPLLNTTNVLLCVLRCSEVPAIISPSKYRAMKKYLTLSRFLYFCIFVTLYLFKICKQNVSEDKDIQSKHKIQFLKRVTICSLFPQHILLICLAFDWAFACYSYQSLRVSVCPILPPVSFFEDQNIVPLL